MKVYRWHHAIIWASFIAPFGCNDSADVPSAVTQTQETVANSQSAIDVNNSDVVLSDEAPVNDLLQNESAAKGNPLSPEEVTTLPEPIAKAPVPPPAPPPVLPFFPTSCLAIKKLRPLDPSGVYKIYLDASLPTRVGIDAYCDMTTDGGGWTLILNYNHKAVTIPPAKVRAFDLPLMGSDNLGLDESLTPQYWGHAGPSLLTKFTEFNQFRFYCRSSENIRVTHFKTSDAACILAAKTGVGTCATIRNNWMPLAAHTALLPGNADNAFIDQGNNVLTDTTYSKIVDAAPDPSWTAGQGNGTIWECDFGTNDALHNTIHRIYIR